MCHAIVDLLIDSINAMPTNIISISGTTTAETVSLNDPEYGYCLEFDLFTEEWWDDRQGQSHPLIMPVRLLNPITIPPGSSVLVEGRLHRWSVGEKLDRRRAALGILADTVTIEALPDAPVKARKHRRVQVRG